MKRALVLLAIVVLAGACATVPDRPMARPDCENKGVGHSDNKGPVVCVSVYSDPDGFGGLLVNPAVVHASRRAPVILQWETQSGIEDIEIEMKDENCTAVKTCRGKGTCTIPVKANPAGGEVCHYWVKVTPTRGPVLTLDPIVKIDTD